MVLDAALVPCLITLTAQVPPCERLGLGACSPLGVPFRALTEGPLCLRLHTMRVDFW